MNMNYVDLSIDDVVHLPRSMQVHSGPLKLKSIKRSWTLLKGSLLSSPVILI